jgi:t-SNARE complex subunit (syntaxin)
MFSEKEMQEWDRDARAKFLATIRQAVEQNKRDEARAAERAARIARIARIACTVVFFVLCIDLVTRVTMAYAVPTYY